MPLVNFQSFFKKLILNIFFPNILIVSMEERNFGELLY